MGRLLRSSKAGQGSRGTAIGPQVSHVVKTSDTDAAWHSWRLAAQVAITALGHHECMRLLGYIELCMERRADLSSQNPHQGAVPFVAEQSETMSLEEFPTLLPGYVSSTTWGRRGRGDPG